MAEEERLGMDAVTLVIMEDKLLITESMKIKSRQMTTERLRYAEEEEICLEEN